MKVLWLTNSVLPKASMALKRPATNKEGWLAGLNDAFTDSSTLKLFVASPVPSPKDVFEVETDNSVHIGFYEDLSRPWEYDKSLEERLGKIVEDVKPDLVHIFGTEYPHTLAMTRVCKGKVKVIIGMQGACGPIATHYADGVPKEIIRRKTFRDFLKKDSIADQIRKFEKRAEHEKEALLNVEYVFGRTSFDKEYMLSVNPGLEYHFLNETLRSPFYQDGWDRGKAVKHRIFLSQGDYPVKGVHYVLKAAGILKDEFSDLEIYVAGNCITRKSNIKEKLKLPSYGKYLLELINDNGLSGKVHFTGSIDVEKMKEMYLSSDLFICPSTIENSPNSLGEAMLLGMPVISANVGGVKSVMDDGKDGIIYEAGNVSKLCEAIRKMWTDEEFAHKTRLQAKEHAQKTHDSESNFKHVLETYFKLCE